MQSLPSFHKYPSLYPLQQSTEFQTYPLSPHLNTLLLRRHRRPKMAALKAFHASDVPITPSLSLYSTRSSSPAEDWGKNSFRLAKFVVIGHRGNGMNEIQSSDYRMRDVKENTICSFNTAGKFPIDFVEFDVQVTEDHCPVIFHDDVIVSEDNGTVFEKRVTELSLSEFLSYGPQRETGKAGKPMLRKTKEGKILRWNVESDDSLCTLQETFQMVDSSLGFNIELKFDDHIIYDRDYLIRVIQDILQVVFDYANDRPIIFSTFHPDAALLVRELQNSYPVFFLTNGGTKLYYDIRRNSLEEAINLCSEGGLQGIVSEAKAVFRNPETVTKIKDSKLSLLTYGKLNNVPEAVYMQYLMGIEGVIVDFVQEITAAVSDLINPAKFGEEENLSEGGMRVQVQSKPQFSQQELSFLLKLIPELIQI